MRLTKVLKRIFNKVLRSSGLELVSKSELDFYHSIENKLLFYNALDANSRELVRPFLEHSMSQLGQDLFALMVAGDKQPHFFVEFGATDGKSLSNTWLLEKQLGWFGIVAEPAMVWKDKLKENRNCLIDTRCVSHTSGEELSFLEVETKPGLSSPELSSIESFSDSGDWASKIRKRNSKQYTVQTISLNDLLEFHNAPDVIQFLSIDTEGSEYSIIKDYPWRKRKIKSICIEHNYNKNNRKQVYDLLTFHGYQRVFEDVSQFDDWYILRS